ncbi:MAG: hypothetical protein AAB443_03815 [Patescibacteria group bacterium]
MAKFYAEEGLKILEKHGQTIGELERAGKLDELRQLEKESGEWYRKAVRVAGLLTWPLASLPPRRWVMTRAYDKVGLFAGSAGSHEAFDAVVLGFDEDTEYYPPKHVLGMCASLATITPIF